MSRSVPATRSVLSKRSRPLRSRIYEEIARHALNPAYIAYRSVRPAFRSAARTYVHGLRFRRTAEAWDEERAQEWMLRQLRAAVRRAYRETEYYRHLLDRIGFETESDFGFDDFRAIPPLERETITEAGDALRSFVLPRDHTRSSATGGSTGEPTTVWIGPEEAGWSESGTEHFMRRIGVPRGSSIGYLWAHHLDPDGSDSLRDRLRFFLTNARWYECLRMAPETLDQHHRALQRWRPTCVIAYAGSLGALAERVESAPAEPPAYPLRCFVTGAEKLNAEERERITRVYQKPVYERYGGRDVGIIAFQLDPVRTLDLYVDWAKVLVEPETEDPMAPILITKLHADAMPMIRYRIGDIGRFPDGSRPGHPTFRLTEVVGREADRIRMPDGRWFHGLAFPHLLKDYPVREYQVVQAADYTVSVRLVERTPLTRDQLEEIRHIVASNLDGLTVSVEVVAALERTPSNKRRAVISHLPVPNTPVSRP